MGCKGCVAASRGTRSIQHSSACRARIEQLIQEHEPNRYERNFQRMISRYDHASTSVDPPTQPMEVENKEEDKKEEKIGKENTAITLQK